MTMAKVGFARVSSMGQDLTTQRAALEAAGCERVFSGKHSGKAESNAAALAELLDYVREGDVVVVTKIDRFGRSLAQVLATIEELTARGVALVALDQDIDTSKQDPMSRAMLQLLGMFAEMERNFIVTRTQEGKAASGNYGGRPPKLTPEQRKDVTRRLAKGESKSALAKEYGVSRATIGRVSAV